MTLEAFLAKKPVVTAVDSGGPNEFVLDGVNGYVCAPEPERAGRRDQPACGRSRGVRRRWARPATSARRR